MRLHQEDDEKMVQLHAQAEMGDADYGKLISLKRI
jgi:hypothetical protein